MRTPNPFFHEESAFLHRRPLTQEHGGQSEGEVPDGLRPPRPSWTPLEWGGLAREPVEMARGRLTDVVVYLPPLGPPSCHRVFVGAWGGPPGWALGRAGGRRRLLWRPGGVHGSPKVTCPPGGSPTRKESHADTEAEAGGRGTTARVRPGLSGPHSAGAGGHLWRQRLPRQLRPLWKCRPLCVSRPPESPLTPVALRGPRAGGLYGLFPLGFTPVRVCCPQDGCRRGACRWERGQ